MRESAVRPVQEQRREYSLLWAAVKSIASKIACMAYTLLERVKRAEIEAGTRCTHGLEHSGSAVHQGAGARCQELRCTNEILKLDSAFSLGRKFDRSPPEILNAFIDRRPVGLPAPCRVPARSLSALRTSAT